MFKIDVHKVENHTFIVNLKGHLTVDALSRVQRALVPIMKCQPRTVSINLADVEAMDESVIAMIMNGLAGFWSGQTSCYVVGVAKKISDYYQACSEEMGHPFSSRTTH